MGSMPRRNNKGYLFGRKMELRKYIFLVHVYSLREYTSKDAAGSYGF